jgi:hypothetical protein
LSLVPYLLPPARIPPPSGGRPRKRGVGLGGDDRRPTTGQDPVFEYSKHLLAPSLTDGGSRGTADYQLPILERRPTHTLPCRVPARPESLSARLPATITVDTPRCFDLWSQEVDQRSRETPMRHHRSQETARDSRRQSAKGRKRCPAYERGVAAVPRETCASSKASRRLLESESELVVSR